MSQENIEIVRESNEAWNAGEMDRVRDLYAPDAIVRAPVGWPEPGPFVGRDAIFRQFEELREPWNNDTLIAVSDYRAFGDRVLVRAAWRGSGRGPALNMEMTIVYTVRQKLIFEIEYFWDHAEALEALGLSE